MKTKSRLITRIVSVILVAFLLVIPLTSAILVGKQTGDVIKNESLLNVLDLKNGETAEVIVEFTSPSLLELNARPDDPNALAYEQKLLSEQDAILDKLGIVPMFRYTGVINAVAITATADEIRMLEQMRGVKDVYLSQSFQSLEMEEQGEIAISSSDMMGISQAISSKYTGDGVLVAVLDGGINFEHEAFNNTKHIKNPALTSGDLIDLGYNAGYYNEKIPFYWDYTNSVDSDDPDAYKHGSHVAGIIAGYAENEDGTVKFSGIAPGSQICAMRVLDDNGAGTDSMVIAALEDAYRLDVDIINMSFGNAGSFRLGGNSSLSLEGIFEKLEEAGIMVVCSAGNLGSMATNTPRLVLDENCVDYGTLSYPGIHPGNICVGSASSGILYTAVVNIEGENYLYTDNAADGGPLDFKKAFSGKAVDIAYFDNYGKREDYIGVDVAGKIVAVKRGELSFTDKCLYAAEAGAIGLIVINGENDAFGGMTINNQHIPAILVEHGVAEHLPVTNCVITIGYGVVDVPDAKKLSYFSAVGVTPDLEIGLDILGVGENVTSVDNQTVDGYISQKGTSMAAPTISGSYAVIYQILKERDVAGEKSRFEMANYIEDATQSTATLLSDEFGNLYSPRFQGSGLIDIDKAVATNTYITTPLISLKDDKSASGSITVEYELVNIGDEDVKYIAKVSAIIDSFRQISPTDYKNNVAPDMLDSSLYNYVIYVDGVAIAHDEAFTLPANGKIKVKLELALSPMAASVLSSAFPYGYFLDGFIEFYDVNDPTESAMHCGYVSFVGDWLEAPAVEPLTLNDVMDWIDSIGAEIEEVLPYFAAGHINSNYNYTSLLVGDMETFFLEYSGEVYYIGENPLSDGEYIPSYSDRNAISAPVSNADTVIYNSFAIMPSLLRSCKSIRYVASNSETGEIYATETQNYVKKDVPLAYYEYYPFSHFIFNPVYTAPNEFGQMVEQYIPSGTEITISIYTLLDHPDAEERLESEYTFTIDYTAPELYYEYDADTKMLTVKCSDDEYLAGIVLEAMDDSYNVTSRVESRIYADKTPGLSYTETFDLSDYDGESIKITVSDYASNIVTMALSLTSGDISNIEGSATVSDEIIVDFDDPLHLYQEVDFTVVPADGYCFTEDFAILVNGEELTPISVENGAYTYRITLEEEELIISSTGAVEHSFVPTVTKDATCVNDGELSHVCSNCSYVGNVEVIPSSGHVKGTATILVEASCTENGFSTVSCTKCGIILETAIIDKLEHTPGESVIVKEPTCVESGIRETACSVCGAVLETEEIDATGHNGGEARVVIQATCLSSGLSVVSCEACGIILETTNLNKLEHTPGEMVNTKEPTCEESGLSIVKCESCDSILETVIIPAKGHDHTSGDKATAFSPAVCGACGESYGNPDSSGILTLVLALSIISTISVVFISVVVFVKKKP